LGRGLQGQRLALVRLSQRFARFRQAQRVMDQHQQAHLDQRQRYPEAGETPQAAMGLQIANARLDGLTTLFLQGGALWGLHPLT
jgi:hypothetical protein